MKRSEMINHMEIAYAIRHVMVESGHITLRQFMDEMLAYMEEKGINPPALDNDKCQTIMRIYMDGNFNQWDEDFEKDEKLMEAYRLRMEKKK